VNIDTIVTVVHGDRPAASEVAEQLRGIAARFDMQVITVPEGDTAAGDVVVAVGGDGTVLRAARVALEADLPLLGINVGRKGFLADIEPELLEAAVAALSDGTWRESPRMTIEATVNDGAAVTGINDVVIEKVLTQRLISIEVAIDGERFINYHADGLILATPTGSTAYNLSAGGPLVAPEIDAIILSPVAQHSLFSKSLVLPGKTDIRCTVVEDRLAGVSVDGYDLGTVGPGDEIHIRRGARTIRFVEISGRSFPARVKEKFHLSEDPRFYGST
jgi:NAD+ kinase